MTQHINYIKFVNFAYTLDRLDIGIRISDTYRSKIIKYFRTGKR